MLASPSLPLRPVPLNPAPSSTQWTTVIRRLLRLVILISTFAWAAVSFVCTFIHTKRALTTAERSRWLQRLCQMILRCLNIRVEYVGELPREGLLVCNHLSYLDIIVLGAHQPISFVSKQEVQTWPIIGWFTDWAGTIYIDRENRGDVARASTLMAEKIAQGSIICLFPEGTSSDGSTVLPFKPSLLQPAVELSWTVTPAYLQYELSEGRVEDEVCYWRDMVFGPHLFNLLGKREIRARVNYGEPFVPFCNRKQLALDLRERVQTLAGCTASIAVPCEV